MNYEPYTITKEQRDLFDLNPHLYPVSFLDDGDLLVVESIGDIERDGSGTVPQLWMTWLVKRNGQRVNILDHYDNDHDMQTIKLGRPSELVVDVPPAAAPAIIDVLEATQHLLLTYRVDVTPRTVRNWLADGKLAGSQLGSAERSPWYTTHDAIAQAATRAWFPDPLPELDPFPVDDELVAQAARAAEAFTADDQADVDEAAAEAELEADARQGHLLADVDDETALVDQVYGALGIDVQDQDESEAGDGPP